LHFSLKGALFQEGVKLGVNKILSINEIPSADKLGGYKLMTHPYELFEGTFMGHC